MKAPVGRISNEYRFQVVCWVECEGEEKIIPLIYKAAEAVNKRGVVTFLEVNPTSMR